MAEISAEIPVSRGSAGLRATVLAVAWRNLWRNPRRTWLMAGGIAFAIWMLAFSFALQKGAFDVMTDNGARLWIGHAQIQHPDYEDEPLLENHIADAPRLRRSLEALDGVVTAVPRAEAAALVSAGERSFGALVVGVEAAPRRSGRDWRTRLRQGAICMVLAKPSWATPWPAILAFRWAMNW